MGNQLFPGGLTEIGPCSGWRHGIKGETSWLYSLLGMGLTGDLAKSPSPAGIQNKSELRKEGKTCLTTPLS